MLRSAHPDATRVAPRAVYAGPLVAVVALVTAFVVTSIAGVPLRDPDGVASGRLLGALALVAVLVGVDIVVRAARRSRALPPPGAELAAVVRERWTVHRIVPLCAALFAFFTSYLAYRNLKSVVPLIRPGELFDVQLADLDTGLLGAPPATLLHQLLGTGVAAHVLSTAYLLLFFFIPVTLAVSLVFSSRLEAGLFYTTALSMNWVLGAASYFLLPSLGPFTDDPGEFATLPVTAVARLRELLLHERAAFLADPTAAGATQSIGAFASLHVSIFVTGALAGHLLSLRRSAIATLWALTAMTTLSTVYFGWHYLLDDVAGALIAVMALVLARALTGFRLAGAEGRASALARASG